MKSRYAIVAAILIGAISSPSYGKSQIEIDLPANNIVYSSQTGMLYATIPSAAGVQYGNRVIQISPSTGNITNSVYVGSEPDPIAVSPDAPIAYVGLDGAAQVLPVPLNPLSAGTPFTLGTAALIGPLFAGQIAVMPGSPSTVAISRIDPQEEPNYVSMGVFDNGVLRPTFDSTNGIGADAIAFGSDPTILYGYNGLDTGFTLFRFSIDASGITLAAEQGVFTGFYVNIIADGDTVYSTSGAAVDGPLLQLLGTYEVGPSGGPVLLDKANSAVIFAVGNVVDVFDRATYLQTYNENVPATGTPKSAANCGQGCVAVVYSSNQIFILHNVQDKIFANGFE